MLWSKRKPDSVYEAMLVRQAACKHDGRFEARGTNVLNQVTCKDCGKAVMLDDALNTYFRKMDAILDKHGIPWFMLRTVDTDKEGK